MVLLSLGAIAHHQALSQWISITLNLHTIEEMLKIAKDAGASDVHITVGVPPKMRVNGKLITMDFGVIQMDGKGLPLLLL